MSFNRGPILAERDRCRTGDHERADESQGHIREFPRRKRSPAFPNENGKDGGHHASILHRLAPAERGPSCLRHRRAEPNVGEEEAQAD